MKRALWIVNHKTLLPAEVPILRSLGYEVFIPKLVPQVSDYRSAVVEYRYDKYLDLPRTALQVLNSHQFYERAWSPTLTQILNEHFDVLVTSVSGYTAPLFEAIRKFDGLIVARPFGREHPERYTTFFSIAPDGEALRQRLREIGDRFVFGQAFDNLAEIEMPELKDHAHTLTVPVPQQTWDFQGTWAGHDSHALFLCPNIMDSVYYRATYDIIKANFGDLPHRIFGRQNVQPDDPAVLPYMTDRELYEAYARAPVFPYPSIEPRHVHYSPLEAMIVGTPVLYMKGGLLNFLAGRRLPGLCEDHADMRQKAKRLLDGDKPLSAEIRQSQTSILEKFSVELARQQWMQILPSPQPARSASTVDEAA